MLSLSVDLVLLESPAQESDKDFNESDKECG